MKHIVYADDYNYNDDVYSRHRQNTIISDRQTNRLTDRYNNKKAQLSLTIPRDAKACQKLLQFDLLTTLSLTILAYLHSFSCCCVRNLRNPAKFTENSSL